MNRFWRARGQSILTGLGTHRSSPRLTRGAVTEIDRTRRDHDLFEYTSGRWIYNEERRMAERRLVFDTNELLKAAAKSVGKCVSEIASFSKMAEGGFNRVFEVRMQDGTSLLARLPYPSTVPRRLAVASEVATLAFARAHGLPVPRVFGYSAQENPVGAEYILMEKMQGRPIGDSWYDLSERQRLKVLHEIIKIEAKLFTLDLPASGSLYYSKDLHPHESRVHIPGAQDGLCIGPYAALRWWFGERGDLDIHRGPDVDPYQALRGPALKELAWIRKNGKPRFPFQRAYREVFGYKKQDATEHARSLGDYLELTSYLGPSEPSLGIPVLRHPDLQPNNILVSEDLNITGLIDWQHASVLPVYLSAGIPNALQNYQDVESLSFVPPQLPHNLEAMEDGERTIAEEKFRRQHVHFFYLAFTQRLNQRHWRALEHDTGLLKRRIFFDAGDPWEGLNSSLQRDVAQACREWSKLSAVGSNGIARQCPIRLDEQELQRRLTLDDSLSEVDSDMTRINCLLGVASDGWTTTDSFQDAKERARLIKQEGLAAVEDDPWLKEMTDRHWPFDDYSEEE